jgi:hypothetical protein
MPLPNPQICYFLGIWANELRCRSCGAEMAAIVRTQTQQLFIFGNNISVFMRKYPKMDMNPMMLILAMAW